MNPSEELHEASEATKALALEVHDLSGRLSAKELLAERTHRLTLRNRALTLLVGIVTLIALIALIRVNGVAEDNKATNDYWSGCLSDWGAASSQRSEIVGKASEERDQKQGLKDRAMRILVDYRGDPNNAATDQAKLDYRTADDEAIEAERKLQFLREQYPPPQIEDFCTRMKVPKHPKAPRG